MNSSDSRRIVIVDGNATSMELVEELLARETECMHLQSSARSPASPLETFDISRYDTNLGFLGDPEAAATALATLQPHAIVAGSARGVLFADQVARLLGLPRAFRNTFSSMYDAAMLLRASGDGPAFVVNTVSSGGAHYITDIWTESESAEHLLDESVHDVTPLANFTKRILTETGVENGPANTRLQWTDAGPMLLETFPGLMPAKVNRAAYQACGIPTQAGVQAAFLVGAVQERASRLRMGHYRSQKQMARIRIGASRNFSSDSLAQLRSLPSFHSFTSDGLVYLVHQRVSQIAQDVRQLHELRGRNHPAVGRYRALATPPEALRNR